MKTDTTENKLHGTATIETKEDKGAAPTEIGAATCPRKFEHRGLLNMRCTACGETIPGHGMYSPAEYQRYFAPPAAESPPSPYAPDEENAALWRSYEVARQAYEDAAFAVDDAQRGRAQIVGRRVDVYGNVTEDPTVFARAGRSDQAIAEAVARREKLRDAAQAVLLDIGKVDARRGAFARRALYLESFPEPTPSRGIVERIGDTLRGS